MYEVLINPKEVIEGIFEEKLRDELQEVATDFTNKPFSYKIPLGTSSKESSNIALAAVVDMMHPELFEYPEYRGELSSYIKSQPEPMTSYTLPAYREPNKTDKARALRTPGEIQVLGSNAKPIKNE